MSRADPVSLECFRDLLLNQQCIIKHSYLVSERKLGFFVQIKEGDDFSRRNTLSISRIKI